MVTQARLKEVRSLATRRGRQEHGAFLAEGVRVLEEALRHGVAPRLVLHAGAGLRPREQALLAGFRERGVPCAAVAPRDLERVADARTPQAVLAELPLPDTRLPDALPAALAPRVLVLDGIGDPGNVGTLLRSALAFGVRQVVLTGAAADPFAPKVVRASAGALFALSLWRQPSAAAVASWLQRQGLPLLLASAHPRGGAEARDALLAGARLALAVGSEAEGCAPELEQAAALCWRIPHEDAVESLNAAVAGSILLQQAYAAALADRAS